GDAEKFYQDQARHMRQQLEDQRSEFGLMDVMQQQRALSVAQRLSRGEGLDQDDLQFARGVGPLGDMVRQLGLRNANQTGIFDQITALASAPGQQSQQQRLAQAEQAAAQFGEIRVQLENRIQAEVRLNEESLARNLQEQLVPALWQMINNVESQ